MKPPAYISITEMSGILGIARQRVAWMTKTGALPVLRPSGNERGWKMVDVATLRLEAPAVYNVVKEHFENLKQSSDENTD